MKKDLKQSTSKMIVLVMLLANAIVLKNGFVTNAKWYWALFLTVPLLILVLHRKTGKTENVYIDNHHY